MKTIHDMRIDALPAHQRRDAQQRLDTDCHPHDAGNLQEAFCEVYFDQTHRAHKTFVSAAEAMAEGRFEDAGRLLADVSQAYWVDFVVDLAESWEEKHVADGKASIAERKEYERAHPI